MGARAFLMYFDKNQQWRSFPLSTARITLGRSETCDFILDDPKSSSEHALFYDVNGTWLVQDLQSRNGVFVNGLRLNKPATLRHLDMVQIGNLQFHFMFLSDANQPTYLDSDGRVAPRPDVRSETNGQEKLSDAVVQKLQAKSKQFDEAIEQASKRADLLEGRNKLYEKDLSELRAKLDVATNQATQQRISAERLIEDNRKLTQIVVDLQSENKSLKSALTAEKSKLTTAISAAEKESGQRNQVERENRALRSKLDVQEAAFNTLNQRASEQTTAYRKDYSAHQEGLESLAREVTHYKSKIDEVNYELKVKDIQLSSAYAELEEVDKLTFKLRSDLSHSNERRQEHSNRTRALRDALEQMMANYEARLKGQSLDVKRLGNEAVQLRAELATAQKGSASVQQPTYADDNAKQLVSADYRLLAEHVTRLGQSASKALKHSLDPSLSGVGNELKSCIELIYGYSFDLTRLIGRL